MAGSDENNPGVIGPGNIQEGLGCRVGKFPVATGTNRRALSNINRNIIGGPPYPVLSTKEGYQKAFCNKNPPIPVHRPLTRKYAAQLANKQQQQLEPEEIKKPVRLVPISSEPEDCNIIDVEDHKTSADFSAPTSVQHTEAMLEEIDRMDEVEMEDVEEEPVLDIDGCDKRDPFAVVEYIDDLYNFYKKAERSACVPPNYMAQQFDINDRMRGILIDWLTEVHYKFELMEETLFLTVNLIDRFLAIHPVVRKKLQLVGVTAMLLACKYEEVSVPVVEDLILISDKAYSRKEVLDMEKNMVNALQFNLSVPTPYVFMRRFLKASQCDRKLELLAFFIIELCLVEYNMLKFPPSLLAAAAIYTAQCTLSGTKQWSKTNEWYTGYSEQQLTISGTGKLTGVHRKYSTSKFGYAAKNEPADFLLDPPF